MQQATTGTVSGRRQLVGWVRQPNGDHAATRCSTTHLQREEQLLGYLDAYTM